MFTSTKIDEIRTDLENALKIVEAKHDIKLNVGIINYDTHEFTTKLTAYLLEDDLDENSESVEQVLWDRYCYKFDLPKDGFGKTITLSGRRFKIIGILPNARKNCVKILAIDNNQIYKASNSAVIRALDLIK